MIITARRLGAFLLLCGGLYWALAQAWSEGLSRWVIDIATVQPAAWLARLVCGDPSVIADGSHLRSAHGTLNVLFGCEGMDVLLVLCAALLVTPVPWNDRLRGLLAGVGFVFAVNQLRLLVLFIALRTERTWFGPLHGLVAPLGVVALVTAYFLCWLRWTQREGSGGIAAH